MLLYTFGQRIKMARALLDMSQVELAKRAGIARVTLSHIETDKTEPRRATKAVLLGVLKPTEAGFLFADMLEHSSDSRTS
jgi:transcriptional regulator with XRE-family HTH domain